MFLKYFQLSLFHSLYCTTDFVQFYFSFILQPCAGRMCFFHLIYFLFVFRHLSQEQILCVYFISFVVCFLLISYCFNFKLCPAIKRSRMFSVLLNYIVLLCCCFKIIHFCPLYIFQLNKCSYLPAITTNTVSSLGIILQPSS